MLLPLAIGAGVVGAGSVALSLWYRRLRWRGSADEQHSAETKDGWRLSLRRYLPKGQRQAFPVVLGHGLAGSSLVFDLHPRYSLARYLAERGFDTWTVDLRGRLDSWPAGGPRPELTWCFDDFVEQDLPACVARVCALGPAEQVFWVGTEMSGQVLYAAAATGRAPAIRGAVTYSAPMQVAAGERIRVRAGSRLAGPVLAHLKLATLQRNFRPDNPEPLVTSRYLRNGVCDESTQLLEQIGQWAERGAITNRDGSAAYSDQVEQVRVPLLAIAAANDTERPSQGVRATFDAIGSQDKTFLRVGTEEGFRCDYAHDDLLAGAHAPQELFPRVADWLEARCAP